jgi:hypothetical protein
LAGLADFIPLPGKSVIAVVIALGVGWVGAVGHMADRATMKAGDQGAVGVGADDASSTISSAVRITRFGGKGGFLLLADDAPDMGVAIRVGALDVDDGDIRV